MTTVPTSEQEQAEIDAALDAALDELDDSSSSASDDMDEKPAAAVLSTPPRLERKDNESDPFIGPPRPPSQPQQQKQQQQQQQQDDPEKLLADMMQHLSTNPPSTGDAESDAFLGQFMQEMQNQLHSHMQDTNDSNSNNPRTPPRKSPSKSRAAKKSPNNKTTPSSPSKSQVDRAITELVKDMAKPVKVDTSKNNKRTATESEDADDPFKGLMEDLNMADFNPDEMVEGMMQELLSKELMYEPMKQVAIKFPDWLKERRETLSPEEYEKRKHQCECFQKLVQVYETDPTNANQLMTLMQDVQEYGQPPNEIIQEIAPGLELDEDGMPKLDAAGFGGEECRIM